jgi:hypothetical protein
MSGQFKFLHDQLEDLATRNIVLYVTSGPHGSDYEDGCLLGCGGGGCGSGVPAGKGGVQAPS